MSKDVGNCGENMIEAFKGFEDKNADELFAIDLETARNENVRNKILYPYFHKGSKHGIMVIHGLAGSPKEIEPLYKLLCDLGYTVYAPRVCGHGGSFENMASKTYEDWYNGLVCGYFALKNSCETITVVGQSNGGALACLVSLFNKVDNLCLLAPAFKVRSFAFPLVKYLRKFLKGFRRVLDERRLEFNHDIFPYESLYQLLVMENFLNTIANNITIPVFLGVSQSDMVISPKAAIKAVDGMHSTDKTIEIYSNVKLQIAHILTEEHLKDSVLKDVIGWIGEKTNGN